MGAGLEIGDESLLLHSLFSGGGLEGGVLLRSSSKLGEIRPRPFDAWMLFVFKCYKLFHITQCDIDGNANVTWGVGTNVRQYLFVVVLIILRVGEATNLKRFSSTQKCG